MLNILCLLVRPQELKHPSGFVQPEPSMGTSELPKFATAISEALSLPKLIAIKTSKWYLFSPRAWQRANPHPIQSSSSKTRQKITLCLKWKRQLWLAREGDGARRTFGQQRPSLLSQKKPPAQHIKIWIMIWPSKIWYSISICSSVISDLPLGLLTTVSEAINNFRFYSDLWQQENHSTNDAKRLLFA